MNRSAAIIAAATIALVAMLAPGAVVAQPPLIITNLATGTSDVAVLPAVAVGPRLQPTWCGFASRETVGSASAVVNVYEGTSTAGTLLFSFSLTAGESRSEGPWPPEACIKINGGLFVERTGSGSVVATFYSRKG